MIIDVHCHYTFSHRRASDAIERFSFEPATVDGEPAFDSFISPRALGRFAFRALRLMVGLGWRASANGRLDAILGRFFDEQLLAPGLIDRYVLLAFDRYFDDDGRCPPPAVLRDDRGSDIYSSNSLIRAACRERPDRFLFGASIHPYRPDALRCLDEVAAAGACLIKWLPLHQNIDVFDRRTIAFLRRCADLHLPVLSHYGEEFTLATQHPELISVGPMLEVLRRLRRERVEPTVIVAHVATPVTPLGDEQSHNELLDALTDEFADAPLYADISALTTWGKIRYLRQLAERQALHGKLLFGTDFPVPLATLRLRRDLGRAYREIAAEPSWPQRVARIYQELGFNEIVFRRAATLLPNIDGAGLAAGPKVRAHA